MGILSRLLLFSFHLDSVKLWANLRFIHPMKLDKNFRLPPQLADVSMTHEARASACCVKELMGRKCCCHLKDP